eukprot:915152-Amphidinium_carterae.2
MTWRGDVQCDLVHWPCSPGRRYHIMDDQDEFMNASLYITPAQFRVRDCQASLDCSALSSTARP